MHPHPESPWRLRGFRALFAASAFSHLGTNIGYVAIPLLAVTVLDAGPGHAEADRLGMGCGCPSGDRGRHRHAGVHRVGVLMLGTLSPPGLLPSAPTPATPADTLRGPRPTHRGTRASSRPALRQACPKVRTAAPGSLVEPSAEWARLSSQQEAVRHRTAEPYRTRPVRPGSFRPSPGVAARHGRSRPESCTPSPGHPAHSLVVTASPPGPLPEGFPGSSAAHP
jgi:hypothetical protein